MFLAVLPLSFPSDCSFLHKVHSESLSGKQHLSKAQLVNVIGYLCVWLLYRDEKARYLSFGELLRNNSSLCEEAIRIFVYEYLNLQGGNYYRFLKWEFEEIDISRLYFNSQIISEVQAYVITDMLTLQRHNMGFFILTIFMQEIIKQNGTERIDKWLSHASSQNVSYESYVRKIDRDVNFEEVENTEVFIRIGVLLLLNKQLKPIYIQQIIGRRVSQYPSYYKSKEYSIKMNIQKIIDKGILLNHIQNRSRNGPRI